MDDHNWTSIKKSTLFLFLGLIADCNFFDLIFWTLQRHLLSRFMNYTLRSLFLYSTRRKTCGRQLLTLPSNASHSLQIGWRGFTMWYFLSFSIFDCHKTYSFKLCTQLNLLASYVNLLIGGKWYWTNRSRNYNHFEFTSDGDHLYSFNLIKRAMRVFFL